MLWTIVYYGVIALAVQAVVLVVLDWLKFSRMPGIATYYPLVGHLPALTRHQINTIGFVRDVSEKSGYPDWLLLKAGLLEPARYLTFSPADVEHVLKTKFENYEISKGVRGKGLRDFLGDGIFNADGQLWLHQRKLAAREFSANRFRLFMSEVFNRSAVKLAAVISAEIAKSANKRAEIDLHHWFFTLTLDAFGEIAFGHNVGGLDGKPQPFIAAFDKCQEHCFKRLTVYAAYWPVMKFLNIGPEREMKEALRTIDTFVYTLMDDLLAGKRATDLDTPKDGEDDLLRRLLPAAKKENGEYDRVLVRDMLLSLIIAGRDTTAASMSWTMYELLRKPKCVGDILEELSSQLGEAGTPNFDNVAQCHFLQAVLSESQRLNPSVPFDPRTAVNDDVLPCGVHVKAGETVGYLNYVMGTNTKIWGEDAAEFKPERWLLPDGTCKKEDHFKFPAFNAGRRLCLGMDMANLEMKVVLAVLLQRFDFELVPGQDVIPAMALTLQMQHGMKVAVTEREWTVVRK
jgi:cytochrome P450